jgi:hypothetical protein
VCFLLLSNLLLQDRLIHDTINAKQRHVCSEHTCKKTSTCDRGFPVDLHPWPTPTQDPISKKWKYARFHPCDADIVPYHRATLVLWGAHHNLQLVSNELFSWYLLKYQLKGDCIGDIDTTVHPVTRSCYPELSPQELQLAQAVGSSRLVSPCEVACVLAGIPLTRIPVVRTVDGYPPSASRPRSNFKAYLSAMDVYLDRPVALDHLTFVAFHTQYTVLAQCHRKTAPVIGHAAGMPFHPLSIVVPSTFHS